jgi:hypothetical protein
MIFSTSFDILHIKTLLNLPVKIEVGIKREVSQLDIKSDIK